MPETALKIVQLLFRVRKAFPTFSSRVCVFVYECRDTSVCQPCGPSELRVFSVLIVLNALVSTMSRSLTPVTPATPRTQINVLSSSDPPSRALAALSLGAGIGDDLLNNMPPVQQHVVHMPQSP